MSNMHASRVLTERIRQFARHYGQVKEEHLHDEDITWWPGTVDLLLMQGTAYRTRLTTGSMEEPNIDLLGSKEEIERDVSRWLLEKKNELEDVIRGAKLDIFPQEVQAVELASCVLWCYGCRCTVRFPEALVHGCFRGYHSWGRNWAIQDELRRRNDLFDQTVIETLGYCPWSVGEDTARHLRRGKNERPLKTMFKVHEYLSADRCAEVIRLCGMDPLKATWREMDERNPICSQPTSDAGVTVMNWRYAVSISSLYLSSTD